ncbi:MAG: toxin-antitoxin system [Chloroflexi bacterium]|nr:toxin-antitoxin system [Chloroflexota bacterium]
MAQLLIRRIDEDVKVKLQQRARRHGRSTEEEVREILRDAVRDDTEPESGLGSRIAARFRDIGFDEPVEEFRGQPARIIEFEE